MGRTFEPHDFYCPAGEDFTRTLIKRDANGDAIDLTGRSYMLFVKKNLHDADADALLTLATSDVEIGGSTGSGITNNGTGGVVVSVSGDDTVGWNYPDAVYDFWEKASDKWVKQGAGKFSIPKSVTPTY